jgi:hypothetical protein
MSRRGPLLSAGAVVALAVAAFLVGRAVSGEGSDSVSHIAPKNGSVAVSGFAGSADIPGLQASAPSPSSVGSSGGASTAAPSTSSGSSTGTSPGSSTGTLGGGTSGGGGSGGGGGFGKPTSSN